MLFCFACSNRRPRRSYRTRGNIFDSEYDNWTSGTDRVRHSCPRATSVRFTLAAVNLFQFYHTEIVVWIANYIEVCVARDSKLSSMWILVAYMYT